MSIILSTHLLPPYEQLMEKRLKTNVSRKKIACFVRFFPLGCVYRQFEIWFLLIFNRLYSIYIYIKLKCIQTNYSKCINTYLSNRNLYSIKRMKRERKKQIKYFEHVYLSNVFPYTHKNTHIGTQHQQTAVFSLSTWSFNNFFSSSFHFISLIVVFVFQTGFLNGHIIIFIVW